MTTVQTTLVNDERKTLRECAAQTNARPPKLRYLYHPGGRTHGVLYALNVYTSCDHRCTYCYMRGIVGEVKWHTPPAPRIDLARLDDDVAKIDKATPILLCLATDPYNGADVRFGHTREVLALLLDRGCRVSVLTKGGSRCLRDLDLFCAHRDQVDVGATLTLLDDAASRRYEPYAASPGDRLTALCVLHEHGIATSASLEPVLDPQQTLALIEAAADVVDCFGVGKLNHHRAMERTIDWHRFAREAVALLGSHNKAFYVKRELARYLDTPKNAGEAPTRSPVQKSGPAQHNRRGARPARCLDDMVYNEGKCK